MSRITSRLVALFLLAGASLLAQGINGGGGGSSNCPTGSAGVVQASNGASNCQTTSATDSGTVFTITEPTAIGSSAPAVSGSGIIGIAENNGQTCVSGADCLIADSTTHKLLLSNNNGTASPILTGAGTLLYWSASTTDSLSCPTINTTETAFTQNYTIPANQLAVGSGIKIHFGVAITAPGGGPNVAFRVRIGSTAGSTSGTNIYGNSTSSTQNSTTGASAPSAQTAISNGATLLLSATAAPSGSSNTVTDVVGSAGFLARNGITSNNLSMATNGSLLLQVTMTCSSNGSTSAVLSNLRIEQ